MQTEITAPLDLLDARGHLVREGWARQPYWRYDRAAVRAPGWRIKEWDYYSLLSADGRFGITLTASDLGYAGLFAICFLDLERRTFRQVDTLSLLPLGRHRLPAHSDEGVVRFGDRKLSLAFETTPGRRVLRFAAPGLEDGRGQRGLTGEIVLAQPADLQSTNIATSWAENRRAFYYNRKINGMPASGGFTIGATTYALDPSRDLGALDWGRGNWTYRNRWYWSSASGRVGDHVVGWNLGYGFSDRTPASENVVFFDGVAHKLDEVTFHLDPNDYLRPWRFTSSDGRLELEFEPWVDRDANVNLGLVRSIQHQVFGTFRGVFVLDDGRRIEVDRFLGFAEDVLNWW